MRQDGCRLHPTLKKYNVDQIRWFCGASPPDPAHQRSASADWLKRCRALHPLAAGSQRSSPIGWSCSADLSRWWPVWAACQRADSRAHIPEDILFHLLGLLTHRCGMYERKPQKLDHQRYTSVRNEKFPLSVGQSPHSPRCKSRAC